MLNRKIIDFGIPLLIAYSLIPVVFILLSKYLFSKLEFASYVYTLLAVGFISKTNEPKRNDFLKSVFSTKNYLLLRVLENFIWNIPFLAFLLYKGQFLFVLALVSLSISMALVNVTINTNFTLPTPFGKKPFEFIVGFRKTFFLFPVAYLLTGISISVNNFNLGVFSMILICLVCISYYSKPENEYFVWNFNTSPKVFLQKKIKTSLTNFTLLSIPTVIGLAVFFTEDIVVLIGLFVLCNIYLLTIVFAKYAAYPNEMNLPQGILIALSLMFPPLLVGVIPYLYAQSIKNLNPFLHDSH